MTRISPESRRWWRPTATRGNLACTRISPWSLTMKLEADSTEQIYVRPSDHASPDAVRSIELTTAFVPSMTGLGIEEPVYTRPKLDQLLGQGKPGDMLRNLLIDGDSHPGIGSSPITGAGFQRSRWRRYEIESYLIHPEALARFVASTVGAAASAQHIADLRGYLTANLPPQ